MKKIASILAAILLFTLGCTLVGCSNDNQSNNANIEYEMVKLTKTNYSDYIAINTELSDYNLIALSESYTAGEYYYTASVIVHISTASAKPNLRFSGVKITYSVGVLAIWNTGIATSSLTANLDYEGNSKRSFTAIAEKKLIGVLSPSTLASTKNIVNTIDGFVYVPKEA